MEKKRDNTQQLVLQSVNTKCLRLYSLYLSKIFSFNNFDYNVIFLPKRRKLITFLKSPHVNKKAQEHFQLTKSKIVFKIKSNFHIGVSLLLNKPSTIKIKLILKGR